jgi:hypothetical protein
MCCSGTVSLKAWDEGSLKPVWFSDPCCGMVVSGLHHYMSLDDEVEEGAEGEAPGEGEEEIFRSVRAPTSVSHRMDLLNMGRKTVVTL